MTDREIIIHIATHIMGWPVVDLMDADRKLGVFPRLIENVDHNWYLNENFTEYRRWDPLGSLTDIRDIQSAMLKLPTAVRRRYSHAVSHILH